MNKFPMLVFAFGLPLLGFMVLKDGSKIFYSSKSDGLSYQIVDPEDAELEEAEDVVPEVIANDKPAQEEAEVTEAENVVEQDAPAEVEPEQAVNTVEEDVDLAAALTVEELEAGQKAARACASCHQLERERNTVGPHLVGVFGRTIGSVEGFRYSDALKALSEEGQVWTQANLEQWLANPSAFADGTKMNFKVGSEEKRRLIAGYLAAQ